MNISKLKTVLPIARDLFSVFLLLLLLGSFYYFLVFKGTAHFAGLDNVLESGEITLITQNNAHCYYTYRDQPMGFEYDLAKAFANYLGVTLRVQIATSWEEMISLLGDGQGTFIATSMLPPPEIQKQIKISAGYLPIQQHIIVHRDNHKIQQMEDLDGKIVHIRKGSTYQKQLEILQKRGIMLNIKPMDDITVEELIYQVANGRIEVTIADRNIALLNRRYYPQIVVAGPINEEKSLTWATHPHARKLICRINSFFREIKKNGRLSETYNRYYAHLEHFDYVDLMRYHRRLKTRLPRYVEIIKKASAEYNFDWRLIAAQMYQESHFNPLARSHAGAHGLMQLTFSTAKSHGVEKILDPRQNIHAGVKQLRYLYNLFDSAKGSDRLFLALGAYNVGQGHIRDAQSLAARMNLNPNKWASLAVTLPLLQNPKYFKDSRYGYCRGTEPVGYIKQIMIYYDILKHKSIEAERRKVQEMQYAGQKTMESSQVLLSESIDQDQGR